MARGRPTISQRISLEGGDEIEAALKAIGGTGEGIFKAIGDAAKAFQGHARAVSDVVKRLKDEMRRLRAAGKRVGDSFRTLGRRGRQLRSSLTRVGRRLALLTAAALAAAGALFKLATSGAQAADAAGKTAQGLGLQIDELGRLAFAAEQSGIKQEQFVNALVRITQAIGEAREAARKGGSANVKLGVLTGRAKEAYEQFGVTVRDARTAIAGTAKELGGVEGQGSRAARAVQKLGTALFDAMGKEREFNEVFFDFADAIAALPDGVEKTALVIDLVGTRLAVKMIPLFNLGADAIRALGDEAEGLGLIFTPKQQRSATTLVDTLNALRLSIVGRGVLKGLSDEIGLLFAPSLTEAADGFTAAIKRNRDAIVEFVKGPINRAISLTQDLVAAIQGRDAAVREPFILEARDAVVAFARDLRAAFETIIKPTFEALFAVLDQVAAGINAVFGTDLTGRQIAIAIVVAQLLGAFTLLATAVIVVAGAVSVTIALFGLLASPIAAVIAVVVAAGIAIAVFWDEIAAAAASAADFILSSGEDLAGDLMAAWNVATEAIGAATDALADTIVAAFRGAVDIVSGLIDRLISLAKRAIRAAKEVIRKAKEALGFSGGGDSAPVLRGGGQVRGPGTPTSDSIPAWLSTTEFVMQGKAVAHYGTRFMRAVNEMRLPKNFPGFALGGLVESIGRSFSSLAPIPAFQTGGLVESLAAAPLARPGTPITLVLEGRSFALEGDDAIVQALGRSALSEERARIGSLPSWHSG